MTGEHKGPNRSRISGSDLRQMLVVGTSLLEENVEVVNGLNVFPVPDGDTGTNMLLTMQSALQELSTVGGTELGVVAQAAAHGSLMGARGNSGVILSQILRGVARTADSLAALNAAEFAAALKEGANTAYRGIGKPVEGTMLTVAREAADSAVKAAHVERDVVRVLARAVEAAARALASTPELLPILKEAGVVDAGGQGYLLLLQGAYMYLSGERTPMQLVQARKRDPQPAVSADLPDYGYCTEVLIRGKGLNVDDIRQRAEALGTSVIVVGDQDLVHLHVHTHRPGDVLTLGATLGSMERIKVENMQLQHTAFLAGRVAAEQIQVASGVGVVAVVAGGGLSRVFQDLGAAAVIPGGQTMNPSIEELVHGAVHCGFSEVILLPNNPNVVWTAQQAQAVSRVATRVVPSRSACQGVAAMVAFNPELNLEANVDAMTRAAAAVQTVELTRAIRTSQVNGLKILEGQTIGMLDGALVNAGDSLVDVALAVLEKALAGEHEVVTVYYGDGMARQDAEGLVGAVQRRWPQLQVEVVEGGQPYYPYVISVE